MQRYLLVLLLTFMYLSFHERVSLMLSINYIGNCLLEYLLPITLFLVPSCSLPTQLLSSILYYVSDIRYGCESFFNKLNTSLRWYR